MNKKFEKEILNLRPAWRLCGHYFCMMPVDLIVTGFTWDKSSGGIYLWRYACPLFDRSSISLTFGQRLDHPDDYLAVTKGGERAAAIEFMTRVERYEQEMSTLREPQEFLAYIESLSSFRNPWVRRGYAMTLLVLGRTAEAAAHIDRLLKHEPIDNLPHFREDMAEIAHMLAEDPASIIPRLHQRAADNRSALGLSSDGEERR